MNLGRLAALVDDGPAMLGAVAGASLLPVPFRLWGASVDEDNELLLGIATLDGQDLPLAPGRRVCVTVTDLRTFESIQVKGAALGAVRPMAPVDLGLFRRYGTAFNTRLAEIGHAPALGQALHPKDVGVFEIAIETQFDQTPGPGAGARLGTAP